MSGKNFVNFR